MTQEAYVSFETAKLLKEKGFDESTLAFYIPFEGGEVKFHIGSVETRFNTLENYPWMVSAPTHQMAMAWLREKGYYISVIYSRKYKSWERIIHELSTGVEWSLGGFGSYNEAVEEAIKYVLEYLI